MITRDDFEQEQYRISVTAGQNQRYHQARLHYWVRRDRWLRIAVAILAFLGAVASILAAVASAVAWDTLAVLIAVVAAIMAIMLNVLPLGDWIGDHRDLFRRWTDLREDVDALLFDLGDSDPTGDLVSRLKEFEAKMHRTCGAELVGPDKKLLRECYDEEMRSRTKPEEATCAG
jgi:hypothetical protein